MSSTRLPRQILRNRIAGDALAKLFDGLEAGNHAAIGQLDAVIPAQLAELLDELADAFGGLDISRALQP